MLKRLLAVGLLAAGLAHADEGMWLPSQMAGLAAPLREAGFAGDAAALGDLARAPLNAVLKVGGATGAFVSGDGLILTNHHVAYGVIQYNSRPGHNLLDEGFTAAARADELPANPDFRVRVTTAVEPVTERVLAAARGRREAAYHAAVEQASKAIVAECEAATGEHCQVANVNDGSEFQLIRQLELRDVRLVYAPPESVASFGGEVDNFMWPRHSGDFALLRAYVDKDGKPAAHADDNVPYRPASHLQVATAALAEGDFAMLAGYPGRTFRNRTAREFSDQVAWALPARMAAFDRLIRVIEHAGRDDSGARVRYASQLASLKNSRKRAQGELEGLARSEAVRRRGEDETAMLAWLDAQPGARATRADIAAIGRVLERQARTRERDQILALLHSQTQLLRSALVLERLSRERARPDTEREAGYQQRDEVLIEGQLRQVQRRHAVDVEKALVASLLAEYLAVPAAQRLPEFDAVFGTDPAAVERTLDALYAGTRLTDEATRLGWLKADAAAIRASDDPLLQAAVALAPGLQRVDEAAKAAEGELLRLRPAYMRTLAAFRDTQGRTLYPDANGTLRVSFGRIQSLEPRDAVRYTPFTTAAGIVEKHTGAEPFAAPAGLLAAIAAGAGAQPVNLLTNLDTTGGNSGSPVLDARGRLIGINFDSNWESVSASWWYDPRMKRAIHVDLRYMDWLMRTVQPAPHLLGELGLEAGRGAAPGE